jgi:two-component system, OmpR family, response regulator
MSEPHILIIDDHRDIGRTLAAYLREHDMRASEASDAAAGRVSLATNLIDLLVLDIMMSDEDRLSLCRHVRETHDTSVILSIAAIDQADRIVGLAIGADDYVAKPFNPCELLARMKNGLQRAKSRPRKSEVAAKRYAFDRWILDTVRHEQVGHDGIAVVLSTAQFRRLVVLLQRPRLALARDQLLDLTGGHGSQRFDRSIDSPISRVRHKIEWGPAAPQTIKTIRGGGYQFAVDVQVVR